ncbi:MAG TPA: hypothetical protein VKE74_05885 [Gemmataceae bacterium]|nr:hypothetical protein [Gemmataceae bacterium]
MILNPHVTRCPACRRFVYAIDDLFAVRPWGGEPAVPGLDFGLYHSACFRASPRRDEYLRVDARVKNRVLDWENEYLAVLARTDQFALVLRPMTETYALHFFASGRQMEFPGVARWREFADQLGGPELPRLTPAGSRGHVRVRQVRADWELASRRLVPIEADFSQPDFARLRQHLVGRGADPRSAAADIGDVCRQLNITPSRLSCPLDRLTGRFIWPELPTDPARPVTVIVQVESWHVVPLNAAELDDLRRFLQVLSRPAD